MVYWFTHTNTTIHYYAFNVILNMHSYVYYLSDTKDHSAASINFFPVSYPPKIHPILINGDIHTLCDIIKHDASSEAESKLGVIFMKSW